MNRLRHLLLLLCALLGIYAATAQTTRIERHTPKELKEAISLFQNNKYVPAQQKFIDILAYSHELTPVQIADVNYYIAACALRLFNADAEKLITVFIQNHTESTRIYYAYFEYANYLFHEQKYSQALNWYKLVSIKKFTNKEISEYFYKIAYSYFKTNDYEKALPYFQEVKDAQTPYMHNALFYYSYIEYHNKNYKAAIKGFEFLADSTLFSTVVPPYICQIYYSFEQYDKVIQYARTIESIVNPQQLPEIYRILAGAYFKTLQFDKALPYYEKYIQTSPNPTKEDLYELGYLYYRGGAYEKASQLFQQVTSQSDTLAQNAYYHLGDCYLKLAQKDKARIAFMAAMEYDVFPQITEDATFIHAKLLYELSYAPFNEAVIATQDFLKKYPNSSYADEANSLLVKIFMSSKNYKDALQSLEKIQTLTTDLKIAYQQIAYYRGLELFNNLEYAEAIRMLEESLKYGVFDRTLQAYSVYWRAESLYKLQRHEESKKLFNEFLLIPGAFNSPEYKRAHYSIGYTLFEQKKYAEAATWYRKYIDIAQAKNDNFYSDAAIRAGDCYYMQKDFKQAIRFYHIASQLAQFDVEYALFQEAFCYGLLGEYESKINILKSVINRYPNSIYYDDALFEQAEAYLKHGLDEKAAQNYNTVITNFQSSPYIKKSILQLAYIDYNKQQYDNSLELYKRIVQQYPGSTEANTAMNMIRNIYKKKNDIDAYSQYVKQVGGYANVSEAELDSLSFEVAYELYLDKNCDKAEPLLTAYIQKYGDGIFLRQAHFCRAECFFSRGFEHEALPDYEYILQFPKNSYTETALLNSAKIALNSYNYDKALRFLLRLEEDADANPNLLFARKHLIACYNHFKNYEKVIEKGLLYTRADKISAEDERQALMLMAKAYEHTADSSSALILYRKIAANHETIEGSEARYRVAWYAFNEKKYEEAEQEIIDFLEKNSPHQFWLGKSYILWAYVLIERGELFQARYTLQNVIQHYKIQDDGIIDECNDVLNYIADLEIAKKQKADEEISIPMDDEHQFETDN